MRKKLLALLMCATMVLGTAVTASAATEDTVKKIFNNWGDVNNEVVANKVNQVVTDSVDVVVSATSIKKVTVAYDADTYAPVVSYSKDGNTYAATKVATFEVGETNTSVTTQTVANKYAELGLTGPAVAKVKLANNAVVNIYTPDGTAAACQKDVKFVDGTNETYVQVDNKTALLKANSKILSASNVSFGKVWTRVEAADKTDANLFQGLYAAVEDKKVTDKAVAVKLTPFVQETGSIKTASIGLKDMYGNDVKVAACYPQFSNFMGGTFTLDADLLSNSTLRDAKDVKVLKFTGYGSEYSDLFKNVIQGFKDNGVVEVGETITFDNITTLSGVFVFDAATVENAGQADADKTTDNTASPKTGDVAPIAALAVVMMGAFGAMVVASKKRA